MSTGEVPSLVIPVRFDVSKIPGQLKQVQQAGTAATGALDKGFKGAQKSAAGLGDEMAGLIKSQIGMALLNKTAGVMNDTMKGVADYTKRVATEFVNVQKAMQSVAAITGQLNTNKFTLGEVRAGAAANLKPEEWTAFRDAFMAKASTYVGAGPAAKLSDIGVGGKASEAMQFQANMAEYAKLHGVSQQEMADFAGGLLAAEKGPTTAAAMTGKAGQVFATLEASSKKVGGLLPHMTRVMAQGLTAQQAAPILAMMPEIAPEEEGTHLLRAINEVRQLDLEGKGGEFGIQKGMDMNEKLEAVIGNLRARSEKGGVVDSDELDRLLMSVTHESIAQQTLRGLVNKGPAGINAWKGILTRTPLTAVQTDIERGRTSEAGQQMRTESQLALAEAERGAENAGVERLRKEAEAQLTKEHRFDRLFTQDYARQVMSGVKGTPVREQLINERAVDIMYQRARVPEGQQVPLIPGAAQLTANETIRNLLERQTRLMEEDAALQAQRAKPPALNVPAGLPANGARLGN